MPGKPQASRFWRCATRILLCFAALTVEASPLRTVLSPESPLSGLDEAEAPGRKDSLALASDGNDFLATWRDSRSDSAGYAARIDRNGNVLDRYGVRLPVGSMNVSWNGTEYVVFDGRRAARVSAGGEVLDPLGRGVVPDGTFGTGLASSGGFSAIVYRVPNGELYVSILDRQLDQTRPALRLPSNTPDSFFFVVGIGAMPDGSFLVLLGEDGYVCRTSGCAIVAYQIDPSSGALTKSLNLGVSPDLSGETSHTLAVGSGGFTVASFGYESRKLVARTWDFDGVLRRSTVFFQEPQNRYQNAPIVVADASGYIVSFMTSGGESGIIRFAKLDANGVWDGTLRGVTFADGLSRALPSISWSGSRYLVAYQRWLPSTDESNFDIAVTDRAYASSNVAPLSFSPTPQQAIALASSGPMRLALWSSGSYSRGFGLHATRITSELELLDPEGIVVDGGLKPWDLDYYGVRAAAAPVPGGFLVAWLNDRTLLFRRLSVSGAWIDEASRVVDSDVCTFAKGGLAPSGSGVAIVYTTCEPSQIVFRRMEDSGAAFGPPVPEGPAIDGVANPVIAGNGSEHLVVWQYSPPFNCPVLCPNPPPQLRAARITLEGIAVGSAFDLTLEEWGGYLPPSIEWTGRNYLVAWDNIALRLASDGTLLESLGGEVIADQVVHAQPSLAFDGQRVHLLWSETDGETAEERLKTLALNPSRPLGDQRVEGEVGWLASGLSRWYERPATAIEAIGTGRFLLLYSRVPSEREYGGVSRVLLRELVIGVPRRPVRR